MFGLAPADAQSTKAESATGGAWRFRSYQEQQGFGGNPLRGSGACPINPKNAAQLDEFRGDALLPVSTKTALLAARGRLSIRFDAAGTSNSTNVRLTSQKP